MLVYTAEQKELVSRLKADYGWDHDTIRAYLNYLGKMKNKLALSNKGKTAHTDSQRSKVYRAEWSFERKNFESIHRFSSIKEAIAYANKVVKSATWQKVKGPIGNDIQTLEVRARKIGSRTAGLAYWNGIIELNPEFGFNEYTLLHELAHSAGYMHHDGSFVECLLKLVSRFMGPNLAKELKSEFKNKKVKLKVPTPKIKMPDEWIVGYERMKKAREAKGE